MSYLSLTADTGRSDLSLALVDEYGDMANTVRLKSADYLSLEAAIALIQNQLIGHIDG